MKLFFALTTLVLTLNTFAQEVSIELNSDKVSIGKSEATIMRTSSTPELVKITFTVPMSSSVCEMYGTRMPLRTSEYHCGYDIITRRISLGKVCVKKNTQNGRCLVWREKYRTENVKRTRTCSVPETYCVQYGTATSKITDTMKLQFKDLPALGDSETETFKITGKQKHFGSTNVVYEVIPVETLSDYQITQKKFMSIFARDFFVVQEK